MRTRRHLTGCVRRRLHTGVSWSHNRRSCRDICNRVNHLLLYWSPQQFSLPVKASWSVCCRTLHEVAVRCGYRHAGGRVHHVLGRINGQFCGRLLASMTYDVHISFLEIGWGSLFDLDHRSPTARPACGRGFLGVPCRAVPRVLTGQQPRET